MLIISMPLLSIQREMRLVGSAERALLSLRFFKTGKGEYGEGDLFLGLTVPESRKISKKYADLSFRDIKILLLSKYHEERLAALLILIGQFQKGDEHMRKKIFDFYRAHFDRVNNWDLVDVSADKIVGAYLFSRPRKERIFLYDLIASDSLWERRIAMVSSLWFTRHNNTSLAFSLAAKLLSDTEDLMQKAAGWMLREAGRVSREELVVFLGKYAGAMPRTMLRYALEHFPEKERKQWLSFGKKLK